MFKLRVKFFAIIFLVNVILFGGHYLFLRVGFENSFSDYMSRRERELATILAVQLEEYYVQRQSWESFRNDDQVWRQFIFAHLRPYFRRLRDDNPPPRGVSGPPGSERGENFRRDGGQGNDNSRNESNRERFDRRRGPGPGLNPIFLLDEKKNAVVGTPSDEGDAVLQNLVVNGKTVGYLGVPLQTEFRDYLDDELAADLSKHLSLIVLITLVLAFITAIPLSQVMVSRITLLAGHIRKLGRGNYKEPVTVSGHDELNELALHLNELGRTLDKSEKQRKQWVADISHELRTPVAILQADLEAIEDGVRKFDGTALGRLQSQVIRLKNLVGDLHDLSLTDLGSMTYRKEACDFKEVVEEAIEMLKDRFEQQRLNLEYRCNTKEEMIVFGDRQRLSQLFLNLLQNSLNYTDSPGEVLVTIDVKPDSAIFEISDSAPCVDEETQNRLTERLFRVDDSRSRNTGGAGLGLSLCANIVEAHQGKMAFSNSQLSGLKVTVSIPLNQAANTISVS